MHAYMGERHCRNLAEAVAAVGGTLPDELVQILAAMDAVKAWDPDTTADLTESIRKGRFNAGNAAELLDAARTAPITEPAALKGTAIGGLVREFDKAVNADAADAILDSVRPAFHAAVAGMQSAGEWITPETQAAQVLDLGDEAVNAWREMPKHRHVLDIITNRVVDALVDTSSFDAVGALPWMHPGTGGVQRALFFIRDENVDIINAGRFMTSLNGADMRGGRWLQLVLTTPLQLNSLTRAKELRNLYTKADAERQARDYASTHPEPARA